MRGKPTIRQVYALAGALCERAGETFPETFDEASELIQRLRIESGHPEPRLVDTRWRRRQLRRRRPGWTIGASAVAKELADEMT
jgi:hypothetical protein